MGPKPTMIVGGIDRRIEPMATGGPTFFPPLPLQYIPPSLSRKMKYRRRLTGAVDRRHIIPVGKLELFKSMQPDALEASPREHNLATFLDALDAGE